MPSLTLSCVYRFETWERGQISVLVARPDVVSCLDHSKRLLFSVNLLIPVKFMDMCISYCPTERLLVLLIDVY